MKGIILASHGPMAEGVMKTASWFCTMEQVDVECLNEGVGADEFTETMKKAIAKVDTGEGVIIVCDLLFGSPFNCSAGLFADNVDILTGMNLPMVVELLNERMNGEIDLRNVVKVAGDGIKNMRKMMKGGHEDHRRKKHDNHNEK